MWVGGTRRPRGSRQFAFRLQSPGRISALSGDSMNINESMRLMILIWRQFEQHHSPC